MDWWHTLNNAIYVLFAAVVAAFVALVRKVLTNEKKIALLEAEIKHRSELLDEVREDLKKLLTRV